MPSPVYIGIDPGASGGLACVHVDGNCAAVPMPPTERDVWEWVTDLSSWRPPFAVVEKVGGFIKGNPAPGSAMFRFGVSYGGLRMALVAAAVPFEEVTPQKWQKGLGITTRGKDETKTAFKNRLKQRAQQLFPGVKITLATCDAILIAEYCRRVREGKL